MNYIFLSIILFSTSIYAQKVPYEQKKIYKNKFDDAIPVLNVATFHMGETPDAIKTDFDENDIKNQNDEKKLQNF